MNATRTRRARAIAVLLGIAAWTAGTSPARAEGDPKNVAEVPSDIELPTRLDQIDVRGLIRTKELVVLRELGFAPGARVGRPELDLAIKRLWNTSIFAKVRGRLERHAGRTVLVLDLEDRWTLNPLLGYGTGGSAFFFRLGATDNNVFGRFLEYQAQYQYFDGFHGGQVILRDPRLFHQRMELTVQLERLVRPRPRFSDQRTLGAVELSRLFVDDRVRVGLRSSLFADRFLEPLEPPAVFPAPTETAVFEPSLRVGRLDTVRLRQSGATLELKPGLGLPVGGGGPQYAQFQVEALFFTLLGSRVNLATRVRAAGVSEVPRHLLVYAGGLDLVRGFPDNHAEARALALANVELRVVAFDSTWFALMPTAFVDGMVWRTPEGQRRTALSGGLGFRSLIPKFVGTGLRFDLAVPAESPFKLAPSLGVYQFF